MALPIAFESSDGPPRYTWAIDAGHISQIPSFRRTESDLDTLVHWKSRSHNEPYTFRFNPTDCATTSKTRNCTEACRNGTSLFTPTNLRICSMLATAALLVSNDTLSFDLSDGVTRRIAEEWQVPNLAAFDGRRVLGNITECITRSCTVASAVGICTGPVKQLSAMPINAGNLPAVVGVLSEYCNRINTNTNTDIAGPGVMLSYIFQTSLALLLYLLVKFFTVWPRRMFNFLGRCRPPFREKGQHLQAHLASSRFSAAVISSLVEFQEVQLYFVGSIQVAALISFDPSNPNTGSSNSNSFGTALLNSVITNVLGVNGVYSILLCQISLQREGMHWWYIFALMTIVFALALAIAVEGEALIPPVDALWEKFKGDEPVPACGGNPSPMTYCGLSIIPAEPWGAGTLFAIFGSVAYVGLAIDQLYDGIRARFPTWADKLGRRCHDSKATRIVRRVWPWLRDIYWFGIQAILLFSVAWYFAVLLDASSEASIGDTTKWSFGQFIAVMVWAPTIAKFIYYNIFGIEGGFEERMSKDYTISLEKRPSHKSRGLLDHQQDLKQRTHPLVRADGRLPTREGQPSPGRFQGEP